MRNYSKQYSNPAQLIALLKIRGLRISDVAEAEAAIRSIGYYRLSAYFHPFLTIPKENHAFKPSVDFQAVLSIYEFDRRLRILVFDQIERIEIAVRSTIVNIASSELANPFWMTDPSAFANPDRFAKTMQLIDKELQTSHEDFIQHFRTNYSDPYPPAWMIAEILPSRILTRVYENLASNRLRKRIAQHFSLNIPVLTSWLTIVTLTRNTCCHHARMWNRTLSLRALTMNRPLRPWLSPAIPQGRIFFTLCILKYFLDIIRPQNTFKYDLQTLLKEYPNIDHTAMGFPEGWQDEPLWK